LEKGSDSNWFSGSDKTLEFDFSNNIPNFLADQVYFLHNENFGLLTCYPRKGINQQLEPSLATMEDGHNFFQGGETVFMLDLTF